MSWQEIKARYQVVGYKPMNQLTEDEWRDLISACILMDAEDPEVEAIRLRGWAYRIGGSPRDVLNLIKPNLKVIEKRLRELGFVRVGKYGWRRFKAEIPWERIRTLAEKSGLTEDEGYVLYVAWKLLKETVPFRKDWKGYNIVHAFAIHDRLWKPVTKFSREDVEWIRQRLVKYYRDQIVELGLDYERLGETE